MTRTPCCGALHRVVHAPHNTNTTVAPCHTRHPQPVTHPQVQARRAEVYSRFNAGFRQLLDDGQERVFAGLMQEVTPMFNAASQQVCGCV